MWPLAVNWTTTTKKEKKKYYNAKKAFDSVDHGYIEKTLKKYGFGRKFRKYFSTLYKRIKARILINGHLSVIIDILRGVKQGDGLSVGIFALCIDPLCVDSRCAVAGKVLWQKTD